MELITIFYLAAIIALSFMTAGWLASLPLKNSSIVDYMWGMGFVILVWIYFILSSNGFSGRKLLISAIVSIWGIRLSFHIFRRNRGKGEDFRYKKWRDETGAKWRWISFFKVFLLQGILLWLISSPLLGAQFYPGGKKINFVDFVGIVVWIVGFLFESIGDYQLSRFKANPRNKGKVLDFGLWRYTRHPNYFGDAMQWWGFYLISLAAGGWWTVYSPVLMSFLLLKVSGVSLLEKSLKSDKSEYIKYIKKTNAFFPWVPK